MGTFPQSDVRPATNIPWASAIEVVATAAVTKDDIVVTDGLDRGLMKVSPADADATGPGRLYVATGGAVAGEKLFVVPWKLIIDVDTSGASAVGDPVYLNTTAGGWTATKPSGADDSNIVVGYVKKVHASTGAVVLDPGADSVKVLTRTVVVTVASGGATGTHSLGSGYASANVLATINEATTNGVSVESAVVDGSGDLTITLTGDPGASNADVFCMIFSSAY